MQFCELLESIFWVLLIVEAFSLQKIEMLGSWLVRGQVNMADEAKLYSTFAVGCAKYSQVLLWRIVPFLLTNADCRHWQFFSATH